MALSDPALLHRWAVVALELSHVHAGPACITFFWRLCASVDAARLPAIMAGGHAAAEVCRFAGAQAALACLEAQPAAMRLTGADASGLATWWRGLVRLAHEAPTSIRDVARQVERLLNGGDGLAFLDFVGAGLKATARDKRRRATFFTLEDPLAQALLTQRRTVPGFVESERMLAGFVAGLWGGEPRLRAGMTGPGGPPRRTAIASGTVVMPPVFPGVPAERTRALYRAAAAHAQAHMTAPRVRLPVLALKPLQIALVGLAEDARVEALAIRQFPGLRSLWAAWHEAAPGGAITAVTLMARLARGLLEPAYADPDGFVQKGRALFIEASGRLEDPSISREIGGLLGHDLGQMRVQFNARTYVTEPAYRDDNMHLWELPDAPDNAMSITVDAARATEGGDDGEKRPGEGTPAPRARDAGMDDGGAILATYPEWDAAAGVERADWTTLRDTKPLLSHKHGEDVAGLRAAVARLVRSSPIGQSVRQNLQEDAEELDLDAAIDTTLARRAGFLPDMRIYRDRRPRGRDLSTLIILDASQSTAAVGAAGQSVLESERIAVGALAEALEARGDPFALRAFASSGREDVRLTRLKDFNEPLGPIVFERLAGLSSGLSTRLGAALRHADAELELLRTTRKMVLVLTDGEPSDIDVTDPLELVEDARRAVLGLRLRGVDVFGVVMDPENAGSGTTIFGRHNTAPVLRTGDLPARLAGIYFRLAQR